MAGDLDLLTERRTQILTELRSFGTKPSYSKGNQSVQWTDYRKSLLDELDAVNKQIIVAAGPWEVETLGMT